MWARFGNLFRIKISGSVNKPLTCMHMNTFCCTFSLQHLHGLFHNKVHGFPPHFFFNIIILFHSYIQVLSLQTIYKKCIFKYNLKRKMRVPLVQFFSPRICSLLAAVILKTPIFSSVVVVSALLEVPPSGDFFLIASQNAATVMASQQRPPLWICGSPFPAPGRGRICCPPLRSFPPPRSECRVKMRGETRGSFSPPLPRCLFSQLSSH